jgi:hypothetical protein
VLAGVDLGRNTTVDGLLVARISGQFDPPHPGGPSSTLLQTVFPDSQDPEATLSLSQVHQIAMNQETSIRGLTPGPIGMHTDWPRGHLSFRRTVSLKKMPWYWRSFPRKRWEPVRELGEGILRRHGRGSLGNKGFFRASLVFF